MGKVLLFAELIILVIFVFFVLKKEKMKEKKAVGYVSVKIKIKRAVWNVVRAILFRPFVTKVFRLWRVALLKCFGAKLDWDVDVYASAKVWAPWNLEMKKGSCVGPDAIVYNQAKVTLEENACLSQYAYVCTAGHSTEEVNNASSGLVVADVTIGKYAWIGTRAFIGMGVEIGECAIVGACACVFKDVEPWAIVGGNPAQKLGEVDKK